MNSVPIGQRLGQPGNGPAEMDAGEGGEWEVLQLGRRRAMATTFLPERKHSGAVERLRANNHRSAWEERLHDKRTDRADRAMVYACTVHVRCSKQPHGPLLQI